MTAAMFLILPKIINELGVEYSRMSPRLCECKLSTHLALWLIHVSIDPIIFISADVTALVIQAVGGAMASIADTLDGAERGGRTMLGGIIIQLGTLVLPNHFI